MTYEQMEYDMRLEMERTIDENVLATVQFVSRKIQEDPDCTLLPNTVRNRHEAYGIAAENYAAVQASVKSVKKDMDDLLQILPDSSNSGLGAVSALCNSAAKVAVTAVTMAAEMQLVLQDLYEAEKEATAEPTPMEAIAASTEESASTEYWMEEDTEAASAVNE